MMQKNKQFQQCHSSESGNPERRTGFRIKPGMTDPKVLRKGYPDPTCQLGSDAIASTILTLLECQFMQLMGLLLILGKNKAESGNAIKN
jgi:hypothetical protein